ncbi:MAG: sulfurtransferase TusA family protein [Candidatus Rokuibacteriota bacterium]
MAPLTPAERHRYEPDARFDGGDLDCGNGLLLLIRRHMDPLERGQLLEFRSTEISVEEDFPSWCRLTGNELVSFTKQGRERSFLVCKGSDIVARARRAIDVFGRDRILLTPDCGFATFADNPVTAPGLAEEKLRAIVRAAEILRGG